ncbi:insulinase family protein [Vallitalea guaymasensis]|uniref:Insulinase family protein n=1 Tax=Vallitalea guaymasensis TaxID=1185412 RepID=A0A8J8SAN4_9FIRM|nr:insulinase family protein [Vallitalea guaymasensis]QUH27550.1 insulinase family protein [Vallitalea guaymasensis]
MVFEVGKLYHGFKLVDEQNIGEIGSIGRLFQHEKSGARLVSINNDDNNKVFSVNFRTPPVDDTGLPHILEHSVLCGSRKFPLKDPFVELVKGSLNTFLNAMTFSDKTMYPVASLNDKDFLNLVDVYMDAVFYPNIYDRPEILRQEGWHYDLANVEEDITIKGVVYNEMKGAFSSPEQVLFRKIQQSLLPDTPYAYESGGDPDYIPELTNEQFLDFHKKYYHPSNSYLYLYGDSDVDKMLEWLDDNYLKEFDSIDIDSSINLQKPFSEFIEKVEYYPISSNESEEGKTYLSYNVVVGNATNKIDYRSFEILEYVLLEAPGAPLKKALIDAGIGKDVFGSYDNTLLQPTLSIVAKNSDTSKKEEFISIIRNTLQEIVEKGIDKRTIEAAINYFEFKVREADYGRYPKGIIYAMMCMDSWLYDNDPFMHLSYDETFEALKEGIKTDFYEKLIEENLLNNTHGSLLMVEPKKGILAKREKELEDKLKAFKDSLSDDELNKLVKDTIHLEEYQSEPEAKETLLKIPLLSLDDISKEPEHLLLEEGEIENIKVLLHPAFTNNIAYIKLLFDTKKIPEDLIPYIGLITKVLGNMDTENYSYGELSNVININTGGISFNINIYGQNNEPDVFLPKFEVYGKCFYEKIPQLFELFGEIMFNTDFSDTNRLLQVISEAKSRIQMMLTSSGHIAAATRAESYFANTALYKELTSGISFYRFLDKLESNFEEMSEEIISDIKKTLSYMFKPENLVITMTSEKDAYGLFNGEAKHFIEKLDDSLLELDDVKFDLNKTNEGLLTSDKIQYVAKAGNFIKKGYHYSGTLKVLQTITSLDYLWNNVRVKGGAYGCMNAFSRNGNVYFTSYRDPNLKKTLDTYDKIDGFISTFDTDDREMTKYIIGTISNLDRPLTPALKGDRAIGSYISNVSYEDILNERKEVLSTTKEDIRGTADLVKSVLKQDNICVVGNENKLEKNKEIFNELVHLFN